MAMKHRQQVSQLARCHVGKQEYGFPKEPCFAGRMGNLACLHELSSHAKYWSGLPVRG